MGNFFSSVRTVSLTGVPEVPRKAKRPAGNKNADSDIPLKRLNERRAQGRKWNFGSRVKSFFENEARRLQLKTYARKLRATDFDGLYRTDSTSPGKWVAQQKAAVQPLVDQMKACMLNKLGKRNPEELNDQEKREIAVAVWSLVIPGLSHSDSEGIPEASKKLVQELLESLEASSVFSSFDVDGRGKAITSALDMAFFNRGFQSLGSTSARLRTLQNTRQSQLSEAEKSERDTEEKLNRFAREIADFGRAACGLRNSEKPISIEPTDSDFKHGKKFFRNLRKEILAGVSTVKEGKEGLQKLGDWNRFQIDGSAPETERRAPKIVSKGIHQQSPQYSLGRNENAASERDKSLVEVQSSQDTEGGSVKNKSDRQVASTISQAEADDESEESAQSSKPVTVPNDPRSRLNSNSFRIIDIGEGSSLQPKVARALAEAGAEFKESSKDEIALNSRSEHFYKSFLYQLSGSQQQDRGVNFAEGLKVIASGQLDKFVQHLGQIVAVGSKFLPDVNWEFEHDAKRNCVLAKYSLQLDQLGKAITSSDVDANKSVGLSGEILLFADDSEDDWVLENPRVYIAEGPQGRKRRNDDSVSESIVSDSASSSGEEESAEDAEEIADIDRAEKASKAEESAWKSVKPLAPMPFADVQTDQASARPKAIKKNQQAANLRRAAWIAKETTGKSVKKTAKNIRENLKSDVQIEAELLYGSKPSVEDLNKARQRKERRRNDYREVVRACIPEMENKPVLSPVLYFESICGPLSHSGAVRELAAGLQKQHRTVLLGKVYARGVLDCHKALLDGDHDFATTKANWLPEDLREVYVAAGSPQKISTWLQELIEIRKEWLSLEKDRRGGAVLPDLVERYKEKCKKARVTQELVENEKIVFRKALSYATGWETAFNQADARKLVAAR